MDRLFIVIQHIIPQHLLSRLVGSLAAMQRPRWLKNLIISLFIKQFNVVMAEAEEPDHTSYDSFNAFFTRALKEGARPLADAELLCPADGAVSQLGAIREGLLLQAKGRYYTVEDLLGGDAPLHSVAESSSPSTSRRRTITACTCLRVAISPPRVTSPANCSR